MNSIDIGGPFYDELEVGQTFSSPPSLTLTGGMAAVHQSIVGDRLRLPLDNHLSERVTGRKEALAHPALVCDIAIGQSTVVTHHVKANLFYRGLRLLHAPHIGDTLSTRTEVVGMRDNSPKPGRPATGMVALHMTTTDHTGLVILDFFRCAMLRMSANVDPSRPPNSDDLDTIGSASGDQAYQVPAAWDLDEYRRLIPGSRFDPRIIGVTMISSGDVVTSAPELARLTLNIASAHHDERSSDTGRLVYGGHTIGIAASQVSRALPDLVTILGWTSCDHTGPVREGDTLASEITVVDATALQSGGSVLDIRSSVYAYATATDRKLVLEWRFTALAA